MRDKVILVTGGTGSFGQAFVREALLANPKQIRVFSRDELKQAQMQEEINDSRVSFLCGDIRDYQRLNTALEGVSIVVHAAAMKRIEKCEFDPLEAIKTNIQGTVNVANACLENNVENSILISTDKAVYPVNTYGATKLMAEKIWIQSNTYRGTNHPTRFSVVRYGNVLGSRGSVTHLFLNQLDKGILKVTDQRMTRYFITLQEAVSLVQLAIEFQQGGEIFLPRCKAASIYQLAQLVAKECPIEITEKRGGEKLHESLVTREERERMVSEEHFSIINPENVTWPYRAWKFKNCFYDESSETAERYSDAELRQLL